MQTITAHITVRHEPAYFSRSCYCHIPAKWSAELDDPEVIGVRQLYDTGETKQASVAGLLAQLKARGFTGRAKVKAA